MTPSEREEREVILAQLAVLQSLCTLLQPIEAQMSKRAWIDPVDVARRKAADSIDVAAKPWTRPHESA